MENLESNNAKKKISIVTLLLTMIITIILLGISVFYNIKLQDQIAKRDNIIQELTQHDSILKQIMEIKYDSITHTISYSYRIREGKILKYNQISDELDKSQKEYTDILNKNQKLLNENNQSIDDYNLLVNQYKSMLDNYQITNKKYSDLVQNYNFNIETSKKLNVKFNSTHDSLSIYKAIVSLINKNYSINYKIQIDGEFRKISISSEKLDSALVLLPYFRDRLTKDKDVWKINLRK
jgi:hypothetical protein